MAEYTADCGKNRRMGMVKYDPREKYPITMGFCADCDEYTQLFGVTSFWGDKKAVCLPCLRLYKGIQ